MDFKNLWESIPYPGFVLSKKYKIISISGKDRKYTPSKIKGKGIQGDYWIGVMTEKDFFPYTRMKLTDKFHDILRIRRYKFDGWVRDPNQGVKQNDK